MSINYLLAITGRLLRYGHLALRGVFFLLMLLIILNSYAYSWFTVDGNSMQPTLHPGEVLLVDRLAYLKHAPQDGDIVIVQFSEQSSVRLVKRVIATAGEKSLTAQGELITVPAGQLFIVGDNLPASTDSRTYGPVSVSSVIGKVQVLPWQ